MFVIYEKFSHLCIFLPYLICLPCSELAASLSLSYLGGLLSKTSENSPLHLKSWVFAEEAVRNEHLLARELCLNGRQANSKKQDTGGAGKPQLPCSPHPIFQGQRLLIGIYNQLNEKAKLQKVTEFTFILNNEKLAVQLWKDQPEPVSRQGRHTYKCAQLRVGKGLCSFRFLVGKVFSSQL